MHAPPHPNQNLTQLRRLLVQFFDAGELRTLCFDLAVDYESLPPGGKADKARELLAYLDRHSRVPELLALGRRQRPDVPWPATGAEEHTPPLPPPAFVDRERELGLLNVERLRASRSPYTLVNAPAGYGKSYLLRHLIQALEADDTLREKWCVRYADFPASGDFIAHVVRAISGRASGAAPELSAGGVCDTVLHELSAPLAEGRRAVLLIFDGVGRLGAAARAWLYSLLNELRQRTHPGQQEIIVVRVIIAGRDAEAFWEGYQGAYPALLTPVRIRLSPFDAHPIEELIWRQATAARVQLDDQTVGQLAEEVAHLSGGHPDIVRSLVDDLSGQAFAIGPPAAYFERHRERLVRAVLSPVAQALLESLEAKTRAAVPALSVFRRVNANTVQALVQAGALAPETDEIELLGDLQSAHLLEGPGIREPFYRDRRLRSIWALEMAYGSPERRAQYQRLNGIALKLYGGWIHNLGQGLPDTPLKATQRLLSIVEWLFHALQAEDLGDELRPRLQEHVMALSTDSQSLSVADLIADEIRDDAEVCYLLRHRLGDDGVTSICDTL